MMWLAVFCAGYVLGYYIRALLAATLYGLSRPAGPRPPNPFLARADKKNLDRFLAGTPDEMDAP